MNTKFLNWYTQAMGSTIGILTCVYAYLNGYMFSFGNIDSNINVMQINELMASYLLLPFCVLGLVFAVIKNFEFFEESYFLESLNTFIIVFILIIGFIGTYYLFLLPALFLIYSIYLTYKTEEDEEFEEELETSIN